MFHAGPQEGSGGSLSATSRAAEDDHAAPLTLPTGTRPLGATTRSQALRAAHWLRPAEQTNRRGASSRRCLAKPGREWRRCGGSSSLGKDKRRGRARGEGLRQGERACAGLVLADVRLGG